MKVAFCGLNSIKLDPDFDVDPQIPHISLRKEQAKSGARMPRFLVFTVSAARLTSDLKTLRGY